MQPGVERGSGRRVHTIVYPVHYRAPERNVLAPSQNWVSQYFMDRRVTAHGLLFFLSCSAHHAQNLGTHAGMVGDCLNQHRRTLPSSSD